MSALAGLHDAWAYPVASGSNEYVIGQPFVNRAMLNLAAGKRSIVVADRLSTRQMHIGAFATSRDR